MSSEVPRCPFVAGCDAMVNEQHFRTYCMTDSYCLCKHYRERMTIRRRPSDWWRVLHRGPEQLRGEVQGGGQ